MLNIVIKLNISVRAEISRFSIAVKNGVFKYQCPAPVSQKLGMLFIFLLPKFKYPIIIGAKKAVLFSGLSVIGRHIVLKNEITALIGQCSVFGGIYGKILIFIDRAVTKTIDGIVLIVGAVFTEQKRAAIAVCARMFTVKLKNINSIAP